MNFSFEKSLSTQIENPAEMPSTQLKVYKIYKIIIQNNYIAINLNNNE